MRNTKTKPAKIFLVYNGTYDDCYVCGVFSTRARAQAFMNSELTGENDQGSYISWRYLDQDSAHIARREGLYRIYIDCDGNIVGSVDRLNASTDGPHLCFERIREPGHKPWELDKTFVVLDVCEWCKHPDDIIEVARKCWSKHKNSKRWRDMRK